MLRLANRILWQGVLPMAGSIEDEYLSIKSNNAVSLLKSPKCESLIADNVAEWYCNSDQDEWGLTDFPTLNPPFNLFFVEWRFPETIKTLGSHKDIPPGTFGGALCIPHDGKWHLEQVKQMKNTRHIPGLPDVGSGMNNIDDVLSIHEEHGPYEYVLCMQLFLYRQEWRGVGYTEDEALIFVKKDGTSDYCTLYPGRYRMAVGFPCGHSSLLSEFHVPLLAISFANCKRGVKATDATETHGPTKKWLRRMKQPQVRYRFLEIDGLRHQCAASEGGDEGPKKALHLCRGHFATYTEANPLFGKFTGTVWRAPHVRGSSEQGVVLKDYGVKP